MDFSSPFGGIIPGPRAAVLATLLRTGEPLTGRQVHRLLSDGFSLWSVQENLKVLIRLGLVSAETVGRAVIHTINEEHSAIAPLRELLNPIEALESTVREVLTDDVTAVVVFGSLGRGEAGADSDIDLAVIADGDWDAGAQLQNAVRQRIGNDCDVLTFSPSQFSQLAADGEPVVADILADGVALIGSMPLGGRGAA